MAIRTALTPALGLEYPIVLSPLGSVSGGRLAAAVSNAGGLGLVGVGYGNPDWLREQLSSAQAKATRPWGWD
jgi:nitronate monooxygenase